MEEKRARSSNLRNMVPDGFMLLSRIAVTITTNSVSETAIEYTYAGDVRCLICTKNMPL